MPKRIHAKPGTEAAAYKADEKQGTFLDPPFIVLGLFLVDPHNGKADDIHYCQIGKKDNVFHGQTPLDALKFVYSMILYAKVI